MNSKLLSIGVSSRVAPQPTIELIYDLMGSAVAGLSTLSSAGLINTPLA